MITMPSTGWLWRSPSHFSQTGCGPWSENSTCLTVPCNVPSGCSLISMMDFGLPVASSTCVQVPMGVSLAAYAAVASTSANAIRRERRVARMAATPEWAGGVSLREPAVHVNCAARARGKDDADQGRYGTLWHNEKLSFCNVMQP